MQLKELKLKIAVDTTEIEAAEVKLDRLLDKVKKLKEATESVKLTPTPQIKMPVVIAPGINMDEIINGIVKKLEEELKNISSGLYT